MRSNAQNHYRSGVFYLAVSALAWSSSGVFIRLITTDLMTILFWRGIVSGLAIFTLFFLLNGRAGWKVVSRMSWPSFWATFFSTASMISGIGSMYYGSIAAAMVILATCPFITAYLAYLTIGEKPNRITLIASLIALSGVAVMLVDKEGSGTMLGLALAVIMTLTAAALGVIMRHHRTIPMLPAMGASAWLCSLVTFSFAAPLAVSAGNMGLIITFGIVQNAMGLIFYTFGAPRVPAGDASLIISLEVPLTVLWVWLLIGDVPTHATMIGGIIVLTALFGHIWLEMRRERADPVESGHQLTAIDLDDLPGDVAGKRF